jgi:predicted DNA-binding transcriptional regulator YafY
MPANKNALIRYKTIDKCLRRRYREWTLDDLVEACSDALWELEGIDKGVSVRTVQGDIQIMRSDKLGYNAPIEVYDNKYYRYADPDYSISEPGLSDNDYDAIVEAIALIQQYQDKNGAEELTKVRETLNRLIK